MTDVRLNEMIIATPIYVMAIKNSDKLDSKIEFPHEFFGLHPEAQLTIISALIQAFSWHKEKMLSSSDKSNEFKRLAISSIAIGVSIRIRKIPNIDTELEINYPNSWLDRSLEEKIYVLDSLEYMLIGCGVVIVSKEEKCRANT